MKIKSMNGRLLLIVVGMALFGSVFFTTSNADIYVTQYLIKMFIMLSGGVMMVIGMFVRHSDNKKEDVIPTLFGVVFCAVMTAIKVN